MQLSGANVILTGGSKGLGPVIARALAARGARVALVARSKSELQSVGEELQRSGATAVAVPADVTRAPDRKRLLAQVERELGPPDVLVNNAGMQVILPFAEHTEKDVRRTLDLNVASLIMLTHAVLPGMLERGRGHVVNLSSIAGKNIVPYEVVYSASKHAVIGFTLSLRAELKGTGVSASVVAPGLVTGTGMFVKQLTEKPPRGTGATTTPEKVARAVVKAIEKDAAEITVMGPLGKIADVSLALSPRMNEAVYRTNPGAKLVQAVAEQNAAQREGDDG
jgi:short-subunit dehydrogenase